MLFFEDFVSITGCRVLLHLDTRRHRGSTNVLSTCYLVLHPG